MLSLGIVTIRLNNDDVINNIHGVYQNIEMQLALRRRQTISPECVDR